MRYFFNKWDRLKKKLKNRPLFLFLDYDGTLTPIRNTPEEAMMPEAARSALKRLVGKTRNKVAVISGRSLKDIKNTVSVRGVIYAGNHGLEVSGPKIRFRYPVSREYAKLIVGIKKFLAAKLSGIKGVFVEDKGLTLSVHFRGAKSADEALVKNIFYAGMNPHLKNKTVRLTFGKKVFEVRPPVQWDKGKVALWLLDSFRGPEDKNKPNPVYIGDDITDEDAFRALKKTGITIFVGRGSSSEAKYYLKNSGEVITFLQYLSDDSGKSI